MRRRELELRTGQKIAGAIATIVIVLVAAAALGGCAGARQWWDAPIDPNAQAPDPGAPVVIEIPGGGGVIYTPPPVEEPATRGELVEQGAVATVAVLVGAPAAAALAALLALWRRKTPGPKPVQP